MKKHYLHLFFAIFVFSSCQQRNWAEYGGFKIEFHENGLSLLQNGDTLCTHLTARYVMNGQGVSSHLRSYEVTALYEPESRRGLVIGAVNHDPRQKGLQ